MYYYCKQNTHYKKATPSLSEGSVAGLCPAERRGLGQSPIGDGNCESNFLVNEKQKVTAVRYQIDSSPSKEAEKQGNTRHFEILAGDTRYASNYFNKNFFHVIIADLPYGVQHGSKESSTKSNVKKEVKKNVKNPKSITRNALGLVDESLPSWIKTLKPGGIIILSWNLFLISRSEMVELLSKHGLTVLENIHEYDFSHRVDQAIDRDIIIARL